LCVFEICDEKGQKQTYPRKTKGTKTKREERNKGGKKKGQKREGRIEGWNLGVPGHGIGTRRGPGEWEDRGP